MRMEMLQCVAERTGGLALIDSWIDVGCVGKGVPDCPEKGHRNASMSCSGKGLEGVEGVEGFQGFQGFQEEEARKTRYASGRAQTASCCRLCRKTGRLHHILQPLCHCGGRFPGVPGGSQLAVAAR